jgi:apolipoprotein N-acyltransferase
LNTEVLAAIVLAVLTIVGGVVAWVVGELALEGGVDAAFRRPSFAIRRQRHRGLMKTGYLSGALAFTSLFMWLVVVTNEFEDDAADAQVFLGLGILFALGAVLSLSAWWRRAGRPPR